MIKNIHANIISYKPGATYGPNIRRWMDTKRQANLGQCFIAIDPECFAPGFETRLADLMSYLRNMEPVSYDSSYRI